MHEGKIIYYFQCLNFLYTKGKSYLPKTFDNVIRQLTIFGIGQFGNAVSATRHFGDGGCKCFIQKKCVFEILQRLDYKKCLLVLNQLCPTCGCMWPSPVKGFVWPSLGFSCSISNPLHWQPLLFLIILN